MNFPSNFADFAQLAITALANMTYSQQQTNSSDPKTIFSKDNELIPYIDADWEQLTTMPRRNNKTWHVTIAKQMSRPDVFYHTKEDGDDLYGLVESVSLFFVAQVLLNFTFNDRNYYFQMVLSWQLISKWLLQCNIDKHIKVLYMFEI